MGGYRWKKFVKTDWKIPEVPEDKIVISTDNTGHRRVFLGGANVRKYFVENTLWVELYYDEDGRAIGFKSVPRRTRDAYRMHAYGIPVSGIENKFGFQDGTYEVFWDEKARLLVAKIERESRTELISNEEGDEGRIARITDERTDILRYFETLGLTQAFRRSPSDEFCVI